jgi:hypothetical protein
MKKKITRNLTNLITRNLFLTGQILFEFTTYFTSLVLGVMQKLENVKTKVYTNLQFIIFHSEVESLFDWTMPDNVFSNYFHRITLPTTVIYLLSLDLLQLYHLKAIRSIAGTLSISSHIINKFLLSQTSQRQQVQIEKIVSMYRTHRPTQTKF